MLMRSNMRNWNVKQDQKGFPWELLNEIFKFLFLCRHWRTIKMILIKIDKEFNRKFWPKLGTIGMNLSRHDGKAQHNKTTNVKKLISFLIHFSLLWWGCKYISSFSIISRSFSAIFLSFFFFVLPQIMKIYDEENPPTGNWSGLSSFLFLHQEKKFHIIHKKPDG